MHALEDWKFPTEREADGRPDGEGAAPGGAPAPWGAHGLVLLRSVRFSCEEAADRRACASWPFRSAGAAPLCRIRGTSSSPHVAIWYINRIF